MSSQLEYQRFARGENCTEHGCRARKWYIEDGRKFCQRGHEQTGFTQTQQDDEEFDLKQGKTTRVKGDGKERAPKVVTGKQAVELYLQCYQLILWKQCFWLVNVKGFPKDLETVVRDLWGLRLRLLHGEKEDGGYRSGTTGFSSTSEGENTESDGISLTSRRSRRSDRAKDRLPKLIETLALCYLGILLLRLPTSLGEVYKWAAEEEIIFTRAIKEVPTEMLARLPAHYHAALQIRAPLKGTTLHSTVLDLVQFYHAQFEMVFPPLNSPLLIFKHVRDLGLPVEIYPAVRRLAAILGIDFTYPIPQKRPGYITYPEIQLMSLIVVATKLSHPFDDIVRYPEDDSDPTIVKIDWSKWQDIMIEKSPAGLKRGEEIKVTDEDVLTMSGKKLDDYLDWYQRTWIDSRAPKMSAEILEFFPLQDLPPRRAEESDQEQRENRLKQVQQGLILQKPKPVQNEEEQPETVNRPGELYRRYRTTAELPDNARVFYELAAANVGTSLHKLVREVFQTEVLLEGWALSERRKRLAEEGGLSSHG
ncbi:hypothetical protein M430DRAFT_48107 [Amorphotheca resinae ATCC 22711]|uniref:RRN7-type domain-containing protein n=1 Tax=Amorphotheca resinae ATCC 22711 TaxID=857342 RepID=A0A2T3BBG6_AMORE|nr:hypothetical protein M430DRAFT_48107 [Amorphotheca resinae ATCC 22711]PSS25675.1 hypothetical protein M430DRAFT_48107 [Amorphotheca resinae ATCC 22711]